MHSADLGQVKRYCNYFHNQQGGELVPVFHGSGGIPVFHGSGGIPVFHGSGYIQSGAGIGDFFRGLFRKFLPVILQGASTFFGETQRAHESGASLGDAAKSALKPTLGTVASGAIKAFTQGGSGRKWVYKEQDGGSSHTKRKRTKHKRTAWKVKAIKRTVAEHSSHPAVHYNF